MNVREFVLVCVVGSFVFAVLSWFASRHKRAMELRNRRFELLAESLRDPNLEAGTRAEILRALARDHQGFRGWLWQRLQNPMVWRVLWFGSGWITMLISGAVLVMHATRLSRLDNYDVPPTVVCAVIGFAMVTLPLALRELLRRDRVAANER